jgi:GNAT superfamily N-acetyltransferase
MRPRRGCVPDGQFGVATLIRSTAPFSVRFARSSDYPQWLPLWLGYNAFYGRQGATVLHDDVTQATWRRFFEHSEPMHCLVAVRDGHLRGLAHYLFHRSTIAIPHVCYLQDLFTAPEERGSGIGRALIEAVYEQARLAGSGRVYWHTHETNHTAQALYAKLADKPGFIVYRKNL